MKWKGRKQSTNIADLRGDSKQARGNRTKQNLLTNHLLSPTQRKAKKMEDVTDHRDQITKITNNPALRPFNKKVNTKAMFKNPDDPAPKKIEKSSKKTGRVKKN